MHLCVFHTYREHSLHAQLLRTTCVFSLHAQPASCACNAICVVLFPVDTAGRRGVVAAWQPAVYLCYSAAALFSVSFVAAVIAFYIPCNQSITAEAGGTRLDTNTASHFHVMLTAGDVNYSGILRRDRIVDAALSNLGRVPGTKRTAELANMSVQIRKELSHFWDMVPDRSRVCEYKLMVRGGMFV